MSVKITYFVHGTTTDNEQGVSSGWSDALLSEEGIGLTKKAKDQMKPLKYDAVFCSDLTRAFESAKILFGENTEIIKDARLRECNYGDLNGESSAVVEPMQETKIHTPFPNGESYKDVENRLGSFIEMLRSDYNGKRVAIVAHKGPQLALDVVLVGKTWEQAFAEDWRKVGKWQAGWEYEIK